MKILFIENRYSTLLWAKAAEALERCGHTVYWMVQNKHFAPLSPRLHYLGYPVRDELSADPLDHELQGIAETDRALRHFGQAPRHYRYYRERVHAVIGEVAPDLVFGESTQFHELLALAHCKSLGIPYLAPNATRYPASRLVFFEYDSFDPVGGCGESMAPATASALLDDIVQRRVIPSYMEPPKANLLSRATRMREKSRVVLAWAGGERYVTPAPWVKVGLDRALRRARARWDALGAQRSAGTDLGQDRRWVLYPLQMQPESNLDVFGQPWISQRDTMERAARALARVGARLVVKPNPKSKYEMSGELVDCAQAHENIVALPHSCPIGPVFAQAPLVLSVTGTVILESIFNGKPVGVLGSHNMHRLPGVTPLAAPEDIASLLDRVADGQARRATRAEALDVLNSSYAASYDALLWDPIARPDLLATGYVEKLQAAFVDVVRHVPLQGARPVRLAVPHPQRAS